MKSFDRVANFLMIPRLAHQGNIGAQKCRRHEFIRRKMV